MWHPPFFEHGGVKYDLAHLHPLQVNLALNAHKENPELELLLDVKFSNHCYTTGKPKVAGTPHDLLDHNNWQRWFCHDRYQSSLMVPDLVRQIHTKRCNFTGPEKRNWIVIEHRGSDGVFVPFYLVFSIWKNKAKDNALKLNIVSAYEKTEGDNAPHRGGGMDRIAFAMLARKTLAGEVVRRPKRR